MTESIRHPNTFYYNDQGVWIVGSYSFLWTTPTGENSAATGKSVYDPCPTGWRVPNTISVPTAVVSTLPKAGLIAYDEQTILQQRDCGYIWISYQNAYTISNEN